MALAAASQSRKERLIALRQRRLGQGGANASEDGGTFRFKQRNFDPETRTLRKHVQDDEPEDTVEKQVEGLAEKIIAEDEERRAQELDLFNIAPKRANWDLKRDMERKLAKLDRKTQESIHTLIRQRLASQKNGDGTLNLSAGIKAQQKAAEADEIEDVDSGDED